MAGIFQPNVSLDEAIFNACDALCIMAGTERPIRGVDPLAQVEKKGCAAVQALNSAGVPSDAVVAAIAARVTSLEAVQYIVSSANAAVPNAMVIASSPTIQFSTAGSSVQFLAIGDAIRFNILSAGTNLAGSQATVRFANSHGITFGMNTNNILTASHNGLSSQSNQVVSAANGSFPFQTLSFSNLNGVTFGTSAGSAIWASHNGLTSQSNQAFSAAGGISAFQTLGFSDGGGVSFTNTNGSLGATVRTNYASSNHSHGNPTLALTNLSGTTASASDGFTLSLSAAVAATAGLLSAINISAGATSNNLSALTFTNGSGVTFGLTGSVLSASVETNYQTTGAYLTTAMQSQSSSVFARTGFTSSTTAGTAIVGTHNTDGLSIGVPNFLTTAMQSNAATISNINVSAGTTSDNLSAITFSNGSGVSFGLNGSVLTATVQTNYLTTARASTDAIGLNSALTANGVSMTANSSGLSLNFPAFLTTAMASNQGSDFVAATAAFAGTNASGTIASNGISVSVNAGGAAGTGSYFFEAFDWGNANSATSSFSLSQLHLMPFTPQDNLSFGQINMIASVPVLNTGVVGTWSVRLTGTSTINYLADYTLGNTNFIDLFMFKRGTGGYTSQLETFASTRNSFVTLQSITFAGTVQRSAAGSTGSMTARQSHSMAVSYPMVTSGTMTSVNPASTFTTWGAGYTVWNSTASTSVSNTYNTTTTGSTSIASTMAGTTAWSSWKMVPLNFGTSLSPGEYWLGMLRHSSTSSSSSSASTNAAAGTGASFSATFGASALTRTQEITWAGNTRSIVSSLGWLGFASQATMAPQPGHGSFSGTWASNTTYLNNAGNPAGAVAFSQINTNVSFFQTWFQMASNRI